MISVGKSLLASLDIQAAVEDEADWAPDILPLPLMNRFAADEAETVAAYIEEVSQAGLAVSPAEMISASKWRFGRRPVALLPFVERVLYRAIVDHLKPDLPELDRSHEAYQEFIKAPLVHGSSHYVIVTDIANFYSSIPTHRLAQELIERTGRWEPVDWLHRFWLAMTGGYNGIPQVSQPSHFVAEAYADEIHRRLARHGIFAWRYSDDFRIAAETPADCVKILDIFDEVVTSLGLFVNERKTYTPSRTRYDEMINAQTRRLEEISGEVREDLTEFNLYGGLPVAPESAEVLRGAMLRVLEYWDKEQHSQKHDVGTEIELSKLVRLAIDVLSFVDDPSGLSFCRQLLVNEPQLTPNIANYMKSLRGSDEVPKTLVQIVEKVALTRWQALWLAHVCETQSDFCIPIYEWLTERALGPGEYIRSQAAWSLAVSRNLKIDTWNEVQSRSTRLGAPYAAASLAGLTDPPPNRVDVLLASDQLDRRIYDWAVNRCIVHSS